MQCIARFLVGLTAFGSVACGPTIDLRRPLCFVTNVTSQRSTTAAQQGAAAWLAPLGQATGQDFPAPRIVAEPRDCRGANPPIVMRTTCGRRNPVGVIYVRRSIRGYEVFLNEQTGGFLRGVSAHEIGHALIGWKHVTRRPSLMNPYLGDARPTPRDLELLCSRHHEVRRCRFSTTPDQPLTPTTEATLLRR